MDVSQIQMLHLAIYTCVWAASVVVAINRWSQHPRVSGLVPAATGLHMLAAIGPRIAFAVLARLLDLGAVEAQQIHDTITVGSFVVSAMAWGCLVVAAFTRRYPTS